MSYFYVRALALGSCLLFAVPAVWAQEDRIREPIDSAKRVTLTKLTHPDARPEFDRGPVDPSMQLNYIQMTLKPSAAQQSALNQLLQDQQDPLSPGYHTWLTPEQYADRFGMSPRDIHQVETWLTSQGFSLIQTARARNWIAFNATASQVQNAFGTEIRHYQVNGKLHFANATAPSIPAALEPMVGTIIGLSDFRPEPRPLKRQSLNGPQINYGSGHAVGPQDLATIYDVNPLYAQGITGAGENLVIIGQSGIYISDIEAFRNDFGLPVNDPVVTLIPGATDPGVTGALAETDLDIETSGGIAPNAKLHYIYADLFVNALIYAVDQNIAPVISMSFGFCEANASELGIGADFMEPYAQQAASQGISILVSSGDSGATMCDTHGDSSVTQASHGLAVNMFASAPDVTGVGGTMLQDQNGSFWSASGAALSYIPETSWNETSSNGLGATGGGLSVVYPKPAWQNGSGFPSANQRGVPDVAMAAAVYDGFPIVSNGGVEVVGGTSAATPLFAGLIVLLNQYTKTNGQGSLNANIYRLAQSNPSVFHDITTGNNISPCVALSPNCSNGQEGYSAGPGYDLVTGWGSVDATRFIQNWAGGQLQTTLTVTANPPSFALNGSTTLTATVAANSSGNPTGTVTFLLGGVSLGANTLTPAGSGASTASVTIFASQLPAGEDTIEATYGGDRTFTPSVATISVGVSVPVGSSAVIPSINPNPVYQRTNASGTTGWFFAVTLQEVAGTATTLTGLTINGTNYSSDIAQFFGTSAIQANGTISAALQVTGVTPPFTETFVFSGTDPSTGRNWTQQLTAQLLGPQLSGLLTMTGLPNTIQQNPNIQGAYQWCQDVGIAEQNGHTVYLTKFLANGLDLTNQIDNFFGGAIITPFGALLGADICWDITSPVPLTLTYEIDGIDDEGNNISATLSPTFVAAASNPGTLSASTEFLTFGVNSTGQSTKSSVNVSVSAGQQWSVSVFPANPSTSWLTVFPSSGTGPGTVNVSASAAGLAPGLYLATLVFQSTNAVPQYYNTYLYFTVGAPQITQVINSATLTDSTTAITANTPISPGLIFTLRGTGLGPVQPEYYYVDDNGNVATDNYGIQVLVNGVACPLLYVQQGQINAIAPYELAGNIGQTVNVQVVNNGVNGSSFPVQIAATAPGIFSLGGNQAAAQNLPSYATNGSSAPAPRGSTIVIYGSGEGQLNPAGVDGSFANQTSLAAFPRPVAPVQVIFNGNVSGAISYAGTVPGSFEGFFQVDVQVPTNIPPGKTSVVLVVGGQQSVAQNIVVQ
jgi:uncharacterized protein (TIGR03437 family)